MEVIKYNPFVVKPKAKGASSLVPQPLLKPKPKQRLSLKQKVYQETCFAEGIASVKLVPGRTKSYL